MTLIAVEEYAGVRVLPGTFDEVVIVRQHDEIGTTLSVGLHLVQIIVVVRESFVDFGQ